MEIKKAKKKFSQNFLKDENILKKIANVIDIKNQNIIEIGPGMGALTKYLVKEAKQVIAFEIDKNLNEYLIENFKNSNLKIVNDDFLNVDLSSYKNYCIIANIPYNISTDIVFKIFEYYQNFENVVLLVQKEFAQRLSANVGDSEYSKLSVSTKLFYDASICFDVNGDAFWPKPKVTSSVIHLKRIDKRYDVDYKEFLNFIKICFSMKRKTLWNNLKQLNIELETFNDICKKLKINNDVRAEKLDLGQFVDLFKLINEIKHN